MTDEAKPRRIRSYEEAIGIMLVERSAELEGCLYDSGTDGYHRQRVGFSHARPPDLVHDDAAWALPDQTWWPEAWVTKQLLAGRLSPALARRLFAEGLVYAWDPNPHHGLWVMPERELTAEMLAEAARWDAAREAREQATRDAIMAAGVDVVWHREHQKVHLSTCWTLRSANLANYVPWDGESGMLCRRCGETLGVR